MVELKVGRMDWICLERYNKFVYGSPLKGGVLLVNSDTDEVILGEILNVKEGVFGGFIHTIRMAMWKK